MVVTAATPTRVMFGRSKEIISPELTDWIVDNFDWVTAHHPEWHDRAQLVLPTKTFFDAPKGQGVDTARHIARNIQDLIGLKGTLDVAPLNVLPDEMRHEFGKMSEVAGTFQQQGNTHVLSYDPALLQHPLPFINVMAHELMHARLAPFFRHIPGGEAMHELATDLHCIIAGFGLFQLEGAEQFGWSGYMSQPARATALAMFLDFHDLTPAQALPHLSRRTARWLKKAWRVTVGP